MSSFALPAPTERASQPEPWSVPRAAAFVTLVSGVLWLGIAFVVGWLIS